MDIEQNAVEWEQSIQFNVEQNQQTPNSKVTPLISLIQILTTISNFINSKLEFSKYHKMSLTFQELMVFYSGMATVAASIFDDKVDLVEINSIDNQIDLTTTTPSSSPGLKTKLRFTTIIGFCELLYACTSFFYINCRNITLTTVQFLCVATTNAFVVFLSFLYTSYDPTSTNNY